MGDYSELKKAAAYAQDFDSFADEAEEMRALSQFYDEVDPAAVLALIAENESLRGSCKAMGADMGKLTRERNSFRSKAEKLNAEIEVLHKGLSECATSLEGEMLQKYHGQKLEDMHPVTRRDYDRDMAELADYRAAMGKGERS